MTASRNNCSLSVSTPAPSRCGRQRGAQSKTCSLRYSRMMTNRHLLPSPRKKSCHSKKKCVKSTQPLSQEPTKVEVQAFSPHLFFLFYFYLCCSVRCDIVATSASPRPRLRILPFGIHAHVQIPCTPEKASRILRAPVSFERCPNNTC